MTVSYPTFIVRFPEFGNATVYPQATVEAWISDGLAQLNACRLGAQLDLAVMLFTAHNVTLGAREAAAAAKGQIPGEVRGSLTSKSIDKLSMSFGQTTTIEGAGIYNATTYGQRLFRMIRAAGAGPFYVSGPRRVFGA